MFNPLMPLPAPLAVSRVFEEPVPWRRIPARVRPIVRDAMLRPGVAATPLCEIPGAGTLLLSPEQDLCLLWDEGGGRPKVRVLPEKVPAAWETLQALDEELRPGGRFPRFWCAHEPAADGYPAHHALVDLLTLEIVGRASESEVRDACERANRDPGAFLRRERVGALITS